jgi:hypothetical protein
MFLFQIIVSNHNFFECFLVPLDTILALVLQYNDFGLFASNLLIDIPLFGSDYLLLHLYGLLCLELELHVALKEILILTVIAYPRPGTA